jgi:cyclic pyranopterin phosphate synthase
VLSYAQEWIVVRRLPIAGQELASSTRLEADEQFSARTPQGGLRDGDREQPSFGSGEPPLRLLDSRGRTYTYLRLSVTDRCDFACVYCMPPGGEDEHATRPELLTFEEAARVVGIFETLGISRVRFTGGEPLVRRDIVHLVELVGRRTNIQRMVMTTNGSRLAELALPLKQAGLTGVNISIDTLDPERFRQITRGGELSRVLAGVHAALAAGLDVKINTVVLGGMNEHDAGDLVDWAWSLGITPRFIELMPLGEAAKLSAERFLDRTHVLSLLGDRLRLDEQADAVPGQGPARYFRGRGDAARRVGFITAVSDEFCASCNRVRVNARGEIRACLASRRAISLRDLMRDGKDDREIAWAIHQALGTKDSGHSFDDPAEVEHTRVGMSLIGG